MKWHYILSSDILTSYRVFMARIKKHPIITAFFIFIAIAGTRLAVDIGLVLDNMDMGENPILIERWVFSIIFFSFILDKVAMYTYRKILKEREMLTVFSQPLNMNEVVLGKYLANWVYIGVLLLAGFILFYTWLTFELGPIGIPLDILGKGILLLCLGLSLGFTIPVFLQLKPWFRKILNLGTNVIMIGVISIPIRFFPRDTMFFLILGTITLISFAQVFYASKYLLPAWTAQLSKPLRTVSAEHADRLLIHTKDRPLITREAWIISKKELISLMREKDAIVTVITAGFLTVSSVGIYFYYGAEGLGGSSMGIYLYPGLLAIFLFLGSLMISALIGLAMISVEGRALYIIKSLPVENLDVLKGKALALMMLSFPLIVPMAILLPVVAKFPLMVILFYIVLANVLIISFAGIGIWGGTKFPNFDTTARNMPDLISQFFIMSMCIICTFFIGGIPAYLMIVDNVVGLIAILVALGWAITIFLWALDRGQVCYEAIGSDVYM